MAEAGIIEKLRKRGVVSDRAHDKNTRKYDAMRQILLIRHGATKLNNDDVSVDRIRGHLDVPLSPEGRLEAERLGKHAHIKRIQPDVIVTSDLSRAAETAKIISKISGVPLREISKGFRPWDVGSFTGKVTKIAIPELRHYACDVPDEKVPRGESFNDFKSRFFNGLDNALDKFDGIIAVVTHHRGERLMEAWKADDYPINGDIKLQEFTKRGEPTGAIIPYEISATRLKAAAKQMRK